jgi:outer membrane protein TolC
MKVFHTLTALACVLAAGACAYHPEAFTQQETGDYAADKLARVTQGQEAIRGPVSLYDAMARALKYNLDARVEVAQTALKLRERDLSEYKMLPSLVASSGYAGRSNAAASVSEDVSSGRVGGVYTTSQERNNFAGDLTLSWNILDFGLSYVRAQQLGDEALIADEMRRKVANRVVEDVRTAYWRAVTYQRLIARLRGLEGRAQRARGAARRLYGEGLTPPMLALAYERELVEVRREIQKVEGELIVAKDQLSALMNVAPGARYTLLDSRSAMGSDLTASNATLTRLALERRPELREVHYRARINEREATAALLELLPGAQLYLGAAYDTNSYLLNNSWLTYGAKASWNAMRLFQHPAREKVIEAQDALLDQRALAVTMAIMTQVHVARARYLHAARELRTAADYLNVQNDILAQVRAQAATDKVGEQSLIREEMNALLAEVKFDLAHAQLQNAFATIYSSIGVDPVDASVSLDADVRTVSAALAKLWASRGASIGMRSVSLLRPPRRPKPYVAAQYMPPGMATAPMSAPPAATDGRGVVLVPEGAVVPRPGSALLPPAPAPGTHSRSIGGAFLPPGPAGTLSVDPMTTQGMPAAPASTPPSPTAPAAPALKPQAPSSPAGNPPALPERLIPPKASAPAPAPPAPPAPDAPAPKS